MKYEPLFVERLPEYYYAVRKLNYERASTVFSTQEEVINRTKEFNTNKSPLVERVRYTDAGKSDQWQKL